MRKMEKITGRTDDMMIIRGINVFPTQIEEILLRDGRLSPNFQIELTREARLDEMTVLVEARSNELSDVLRKDISKNLKHQIKNRIGVTAKINLLATGGVERSVGKARRIVDKRITETA